MTVEMRLLSEDDLPVLRTFLEAHADSSMFLRSNLRRAGIYYRGQPLQAQYVGAFHDDELRGVVAHATSGNVLLQAPEHLVELVKFAIELSGRAVQGLIGPGVQVTSARMVLGMDERHARLDGKEVLMSLELAWLQVPSALLEGAVHARQATAADHDELSQWRLEYEIEACGMRDVSGTRRLARENIERSCSEGSMWLLESHGIRLAMSNFSAMLPDMVQIGGVYTPPHLRNKGHARAVIAGSLLAVRNAGVQRAVLFTPNPSAVRCYASLGFSEVGDYSLTLFD